MQNQKLKRKRKHFTNFETYDLFLYDFLYETCR